MAATASGADSTRNNEHNTDDRLNWRYQDKAYNEQFKKWRKQTKDSLGFYYVNKPNELIYRDGFGFVKAYPEAVEGNALRHVNKIIGIALLLLTFFDVLHIYVLPLILNKLGFDIYFDFFAGTLYGDNLLILALSVITEIIKRVFPFIVCYKYLHMPIKVMMPMKITNKPLFAAAAPIMLMVSGVCAAATGVYDAIFGMVHIEPVLWMRLPDETYILVLSLLFNVIIIPILSELCTRGVILQLLRQFGDGYAIIFTSLITALITYNINQFCYVFVTSMVIGYFTVRSGSVVTAMIMRIIARVVAYAIYAIDHFVSDEYSGVIVMAMLFLCIMIGLVVTVMFMIKHSDKLGMSLKSRYLTFSQKCLTSFTNISVVIWVCGVVILTLLNVKFSF